MNDLIINTARLNLLRVLSHRLVHKIPDNICCRAFINCMNKKAKELGMNHSEFINPSGLGEDNVYSVSTARDLAIMAAKAQQNDIIKTIWKTKEKHIQITKPYFYLPHNKQQKKLCSTIHQSLLDDKYPILGAKTGSGDGYQTLVMVCNLNGYTVSGAIMNAGSDTNRFAAMSELMEIASLTMGNTKDTIPDVVSARNACAILINLDGKFTSLYEKNADEMSSPMSTTKVITIMTALDYIDDLTKETYITPHDLRHISSDIFYRWDRTSVFNLLYAAMLTSSNVAANALARIAGESFLSS